MKKIKKECYVAGILFIVFIALTFFVNMGKLDYFDTLIYNGLITIKNNFITSFLYVITQLASTSSIIIILILLLTLLLSKKDFLSGKYLTINVALGSLITIVIKQIIKRPRPYWKWITQDGYSYPSGHTITSFLLYGTIILIVNKKVKGKLKKPLIIFCGIMMFLTGLSRIYFGAHYLTDVLASLILGCIILIISNMFMSKEFNNDKNKNREAIQTK